MLLANAGQRLFHIFVRNRNLRMFGAQLLIALDANFGHHLEAGFESEGLAILNVQLGDARLRHRDHPQLLGFFAEIAGDQRLHYVALQILGKAVTDHRRWHVPLAESGQPRHLLIFQDDGFGLASDFIGGDFHRNLPLDTVFIVLRFDRIFRSLPFLRDSLLPFSSWSMVGLEPCVPSSQGTRPHSHNVNFSVKTEGEQRQTAQSTFRNRTPHSRYWQTLARARLESRRKVNGVMAIFQPLTHWSVVNFHTFIDLHQLLYARLDGLQTVRILV